ncbi:MAG: hypothetical protein NZL87_07370 [Thermomicrobium sp.]|nr:hypothetical protein [Thermomicrobium sp.]MDW7982123.1 STM3941 family protein [Thermomicrobium sp.]
MDVPTRYPAQPLLVRRSRLRAGLTAVLGLAFGVGAVWYAVTAGTGIERLFAVSMAVFLGFVAALATVAALDRTPVLEVDADGIVDRGSPVHAGRLRWEEIKRVEAKRVGRQSLLAVHVYRPHRFVVDLPSERRQAAEEAIQRHGTPFIVPWAGMDQRLDIVVERAEAYRRAALERR